jgi:hypothetical protein
LSSVDDVPYLKKIVGAKLILTSNFLINACYGIFLSRYSSYDFGCSFLISKFDKFVSKTPQKDLCQAQNYVFSAIAVFVISDLICLFLIRALNKKLNVSRKDRVYNFGLINGLVLMSFLLVPTLAGFIRSELRIPRSGFNIEDIDLNIFMSHEMMRFGLFFGVINSILLAIYIPQKYINVERNEKLREHQRKIYERQKNKNH